LQETDQFTQELVKGNEKISCAFKMVFEGTTVDLKTSQVYCTLPITVTLVKAYEIRSDFTGNVFTITIRIIRRSGKGVLQIATLQLGKTEITSEGTIQSRETSTLSPPNTTQSEYETLCISLHVFFITIVL
jgi:hypothetical protein